MKVEVQDRSRIVPTSEISAFSSEKLTLRSSNSDISSSSGVVHARVTREPFSHLRHMTEIHETFSVRHAALTLKCQKPSPNNFQGWVFYHAYIYLWNEQ